MNDKRSGEGCWYFTYITECPICGYNRADRERRYTPKPDDYYDRSLVTFYACSDHFL